MSQDAPTRLSPVPRAADVVLQRAVRRLVEAYRPERVYLFGSCARGDAGPDSDYDLVVVVPDDAKGERLRSRTAYRILADLRAPIDVVVWTAGKFDRRQAVPSSIPAAAVREGCLLHG